MMPGSTVQLGAFKTFVQSPFSSPGALPLVSTATLGRPQLKTKAHQQY